MGLTEAEKAQARLNRARARARARAARRDPLRITDAGQARLDLTPEQQARLDELIAVYRAEAEAEGVKGLDSGLVQGVIRARAASVLHDELNPGAAERRRQLWLSQERDARIKHMTARGFPRTAVVAAIDGRVQVGGSFIELVPMEDFDWLADRAARGARLLALVGLMGTGKTFTATRWVMEQTDARFVLARDFYALSPNYEPDRIKAGRFQRCAVLVVDEIGWGEESEVQSARLEALFHVRFENGLVTVPIGNMDDSEFAARYGDRIMSRLLDMGAIRYCKTIMRRGERRRQEGLPF